VKAVLDLHRVVIGCGITYSWIMAVRRFATTFRNFLNHPGKVATLCVICFAVTLILNGLLWRLWSLRRDYARLTHEISSTQSGIEKLTEQLKQAKDPSFIERQARDKLDLVGEKDLVFVFSDQ
jgi:cell division protein FtsB